MGSVPLHPALVHVPLALAVLIPFAALVALFVMWRGRAGRGAWAAVVATQAVLVAGGLVALRTGSSDEDRVEDLVPETAIERHEEAAEVFVWGAGVVLLISSLGLAGPDRVRRVVAGSATLGTLVVAGLGVRTGKAGGELVYVHGAAGAGGATQAEAQGERSPSAGRDEDDDDRPGTRVAVRP